MSCQNIQGAVISENYANKVCNYVVVANKKFLK